MTIHNNFDHSFNLGLVWLRRDLRLEHHTAIYSALKQCKHIQLVFVFDTHILNTLKTDDKRLSFIWQALNSLDEQLAKHGCKPVLRLYGQPEVLIPKLCQQLNIDAVFVHDDYEPYAKNRDTNIKQSLAPVNTQFFSFKDHILVEHPQLLNKQQQPYQVFTPYKKAVLAYIQGIEATQTLNNNEQSTYLNPIFAQQAYTLQSLLDLNMPAKMQYLDVLNLTDVNQVNTLEAMNFTLQDLSIQGSHTQAYQYWHDFKQRIDQYKDKRDYPAVKGVSYLSVYLRFGLLSFQTLAYHAYYFSADKMNNTWLSELIWHDFYSYILHHFAYVADGKSFKADYDLLGFKQNEAHFKAWCAGQTGYPIVDAGMRQLNQTGYMHNRLRMIVASFLTKDLGLDWRLGEAYFAEKLLDYEFASNNGGWQWCASTGCDAQPYFRIFNPYLQSKKFDEDGKFIAKYVPELASLDKYSIHEPHLVEPLMLASKGIRLGQTYPLPMVEHFIVKDETLARYELLKKQTP